MGIEVVQRNIVVVAAVPPHLYSIFWSGCGSSSVPTQSATCAATAAAAASATAAACCAAARARTRLAWSCGAGQGQGQGRSTRGFMVSCKAPGGVGVARLHPFSQTRTNASKDTPLKTPPPRRYASYLLDRAAPLPTGNARNSARSHVRAHPYTHTYARAAAHTHSCIP